jgi:RHS repeat-associated protein
MPIFRHTLTLRALAPLAVVLALATPARAAEHRFDLLLDTDNSVITGCTVNEPAQSVAGIEQKLSIYVDTSTTGATVNRLTRQVCAGGVLGSEAVVDATGWPVGLGVGIGGTAAIEAYIARDLLPNKGTLRVVTASDTNGAGDIAPAFTLPLGDVAPPPPPPPPPAADAIAVPLAPWLSAAIALLLVLCALHWLRRHPQHAALVVPIVLCAASALAWAASVVLDGQVGDWTGVPPSVTDPKGDAPVDTDIVAVFAQRDATRLYFRIDADVEPDGVAPSNAPPVVSAGADQSITLPATAALAGSASDDGLPDPPGALTLTWTAAIAPAAVTFADAHSATTTATFTQPGNYTLRLTASDSALSTSSDMHVNVSAAGAALTLAPVADRIVIVGAHFQAPLVAHASAPVTLTYSLVSAPAGAGIAAGPDVDWTPTRADVGSNAFIASVSDGLGHSATTQFTVTVVYTNHPPQLATQPDATLPVGGEFTRVLAATDPDAGDTLTYALVAGPPGLTLVGATLDWATGSASPGDYGVTVKVTDAGGLTDTQHFVIRLTAAAPPPVANDDAYSVHLGDTLVVAAPGVLGNDVDPSGANLTASKTSNPDKGTLGAFSSDGGFTYTAPATPPGPAFLPVKKWNNGVAFASGNGNARVADVFGNGKPVVFAPREGSDGGIVAIDGATGVTLWQVDGRLPAPNDDCVIESDDNVDELAVGDIDDSGVPALVSPAKCFDDNPLPQISGATRMIALNARTGALKWLTPPLGQRQGDGGTGAYFPMTWNATPAIARLHPGETPSVLFKQNAVGFLDNAQTAPACDQFKANSGLLYCAGVLALDGADGSVRQRFIAPGDGFQIDGFNTYGYVMVADLTGSGSPNVIAVGAVWDADGNLVSNRLGGFYYSLALAKLDASGQVSIISEERRGFDEFVVARHADGNVQWQAPIDASTVHGQLSVADLDGDGSPEIMDTIEGNLYVYDAHGQLKWTHRYADSGNNRTIDEWKRPVAFDLDGDGIAEVIMPTNDGVEFTDGATGKTRTVIPWADLGVTSTGYGGGYAPNGHVSAMVADIDGSGHASVVVTVPSVSYGATQYVVAIGAQNNDWRPARPVFNEFGYHDANVADDGSIPLAEADNFALARTNVYGNQPQAVDPVDPRVVMSTTFTYTASNATQTSMPATVTLSLLPPNRPPVFTTTAPTHYVPTSLVYAAHATDPDPGDSVTYAIRMTSGNGAPGCTIDAANGTLTCPSLFAGDEYVVLSATDSQGAVVYQTLALHQSAGSAAVPSVVGELQADAAATLDAAGFALGAVQAIDSSAPVGQVLSQSPSGGATAVLGESVAVTVSHGPAPVAVPDVVGLGLPVASSMLAGLGFTPAPDYQFSSVATIGTVLAQTPAAGTLLAPIPANPVGVTVSLGAAPTGASLAQIIITPPETAALVGKTATFTNRAIYSDHSARDYTHVTTWLSSDTSVATIDSGGVAHALHAGTTTITAAVGAIAGNATLHVIAPVPGDSTLPVALITAPVGGSEVTGITPITGTATDANFLRYELAIAASADDSFTIIGQGAAPVSDGVLGSLDPTLLLNGAYTLRLTVYDAGGNTTVANTTFIASGSQKVGNFTLSYTDLTVLLSGIPIQITRTYDSRDKRLGDFGIGWSLGIDALQVSTSGVIGESWEVGLSGTTYYLVADVNHFVSVTLPSGRVETFDVQLSPTTSPLQQFSTLQASFVPRAGVQGALTSLDNTNLLVIDPQPGPVTLVDDTTLDTFNPDRFIYTQRDGIQFVVTRTHGVESVKDTSGNQITITPGGISHSSGASVAFDRDATGRIVGIADPAGNKRAYAYTANGDLGAATDRAGNTTRYTYDGQHDVLRVDDPLGRPVKRADYDEDGRLIALTDASGHTITYAHDLPGHLMQVTDPLGRTTVIGYDDRGNVLSRTDPLGHTVTMTYDASDNLLSRTDALGHATSYTYTAGNDVASITDPLGRTQSFTHDDAGHVLTSTDAAGHVTTMQYDAGGHLTGMVDALGHSTTSTWDSAGNLTGHTDAAGASSTNQYDVLGRRTTLAKPLGAPVTMQYSNTGQLTGQQAAGSAAWTLAYDANGNLIGTTQGGVARALSYDASGTVTSVTTSAGAAILFNYDDAGRFTGVSEAASGAVRNAQTYDAAGNPVSMTDSLGNTTQLVRDAGNRVTSMTYPGGAAMTQEYDAANRLTRVVDPLGHATTYDHDDAGQLVRVTDAAGSVTAYTHDANGNVSSIIDGLGHATSYTYDDTNRLTRTTYADGRFETRTYDPAGRVVQVVDVNGHATGFAYDALGRVTTVTDAAGHATTYQYGSVSSPTAMTDANGHTSHYAYDGNGRLALTTYPLGDTSAATYDASGRLLSRTNGNGDTTLYTYDARGRLVTVKHPDGSSVGYAYTDDGLVASMSDAHGTTTFDYDPATRVPLKFSEPDGRYVRYEYDAGGNRTAVAYGTTGNERITRYTYDVANRVVGIVDPDGGTATIAYDAAGNRSSIALANGTTISATYDLRNRPLSLTQHNNVSTVIAREAYTLDAAGNRTRVDRLDGSHVEFQYDSLDRVVREKRYASGGALTDDLAYAYDAVGNRVSAGPAASPASFAFNADNQLTSGAGIDYSYDAAGRRIGASFTVGPTLVTRTYAWDAEDHLVSFVDSQTAASTAYLYDIYGTRLAKSGVPRSETYLVDRAAQSEVSQVLHAASAAGDEDFTWGPDLVAARIAGAPRYPLHDALGSTLSLTDSAAAVTDTFAYDSPGNTIARSGTAHFTHRFAGEEADDESGLVYLRARYYDPAAGVFLSRDPEPGKAREPMSWNAYLYVNANPVNHVDPTGHEELIELVETQAISEIPDRAELVDNARNGIQEAQEVLAEILRLAAAGISMEALAESATDSKRVMYWFGGVLGNPLGAPLFDAGSHYLDVVSWFPAGSGLEFFGLALRDSVAAIPVAAQLALGKAVIDMVADQTPLSLAVTSIYPGALEHCANTGALAAADRRPYWNIFLCPPFFDEEPLPVVFGPSSMAGVIVHEFMHSTSKGLIQDDAYGCDEAGVGNVPEFPGVRALLAIPGKALFSADAYECWVEDNAANFGQPIGTMPKSP